MGLFKKLFGPSLDELAAREIVLKKARQNQTQQIQSQQITQSFKEKLKAWKPPTLRPPEKIGDYILNKEYSYKDVTLKVIPDNIKFDFNMIGREVSLISEPSNEYDPGAIPYFYLIY